MPLLLTESGLVGQPVGITVFFGGGEADPIGSEADLPGRRGLIWTHLKSLNYTCGNVVKLSMFLQHLETKDLLNIYSLQRCKTKFI